MAKTSPQHLFDFNAPFDCKLSHECQAPQIARYMNHRGVFLVTSMLNIFFETGV